ncbi:hypothetical protein CRUP_016320 [Coryphaenoides rupestris]|nr:hypothetical protein CRUP_016320 [Coryphaenoides rupestris]
MAASIRSLDGAMLSIRLLRGVQLHHERALSTSLHRLAFTPPVKPVIVDKTQTVASLRKYVKVRMLPKPWSKRWERPTFDIKGIRFDLCLTPEQMEHAQKWAKPWVEYDMLKEYDTSKLGEDIYAEVQKGAEAK